jgi:hypothetical protein
MIPNGVLLQCAVTPLREPERVEFKARFDAGTTPRDVQEMIGHAITVPLRFPPHIAVEELDRDDVVVRIVTTPTEPRDGATLAEEVLAGVRDTAGASTAGQVNGGGAGERRDDDGNGRPEPT